MSSPAAVREPAAPPESRPDPPKPRSSSRSSSSMDQSSATPRPASSLCSPAPAPPVQGQLSVSSVQTMLQTVRRSLKSGQLKLTPQHQPSSDDTTRLLKRMALLGVVTWAQVSAAQQQQEQEEEEQGEDKDKGGAKLGGRGLGGGANDNDNAKEEREAWLGSLAEEEQHMWAVLAQASPPTRAGVLALATRQYVAKLLELHMIATQHGGGACGGVFLALEEQLRAFSALPSLSMGGGGGGGALAAGQPLPPPPSPAPTATATPSASASASGSSCKGLGDLCYTFVSYDHLPQPQTQPSGGQQQPSDRGGGVASSSAGMALFQHVLLHYEHYNASYAYGPYGPSTDVKQHPPPPTLALAAQWLREGPQGEGEGEGLQALRATLERLLEEDTTVLPIKLAPDGYLEREVLSSGVCVDRLVGLQHHVTLCSLPALLARSLLLNLRHWVLSSSSSPSSLSLPPLPCHSLCPYPSPSNGGASLGGGLSSASLSCLWASMTLRERQALLSKLQHSATHECKRQALLLTRPSSSSSSSSGVAGGVGVGVGCATSGGAVRALASCLLQGLGVGVSHHREVVDFSAPLDDQCAQLATRFLRATLSPHVQPTAQDQDHEPSPSSSQGEGLEGLAQCAGLGVVLLEALTMPPLWCASRPQRPSLCHVLRRALEEHWADLHAYTLLQEEEEEEEEEDHTTTAAHKTPGPHTQARRRHPEGPMPMPMPVSVSRPRAGADKEASASANASATGAPPKSNNSSKKKKKKRRPAAPPKDTQPQPTKEEEEGEGEGGGKSGVPAMPVPRPMPVAMSPARPPPSPPQPPQAAPAPAPALPSWSGSYCPLLAEEKKAKALDLIAWDTCRRVRERLSLEMEDMAQGLAHVAARRRPWQLCALTRLEQLIHKNWPHATMHVYGSFTTGLSIPASDVDVVLTSLPPNDGLWRPHPSPSSGAPSSHHLLSALSEALGQESWVSSVQCLPHASVPLIKLCTAPVPTSCKGDSRGVIKIDISLDFSPPTHPTDPSHHQGGHQGGGGHYGLMSSALVQRLCASLPMLRPLVLVLKQLFLQHGLHDAYTGGLSSYALTIMAASLLQRHVLEAPDLRPDLGTLLVTFLHKFGSAQLDVRKHGVCLNPSTGPLFTLSSFSPHLPRAGTPEYWRQVADPVVIQDPLMPSNNVGRSCFGFRQVQLLLDQCLYRLRHHGPLLVKQHDDASSSSSSSSKGSDVSSWPTSLLGLAVFGAQHHRHVVALSCQTWCPPEIAPPPLPSPPPRPFPAPRPSSSARPHPNTPVPMPVPMPMPVGVPVLHWSLDHPGALLPPYHYHHHTHHHHHHGHPPPPPPPPQQDCYSYTSPPRRSSSSSSSSFRRGAPPPPPRRAPPNPHPPIQGSSMPMPPMMYDAPRSLYQPLWWSSSSSPSPSTSAASSASASASSSCASSPRSATSSPRPPKHPHPSPPPHDTTDPTHQHQHQHQHQRPPSGHGRYSRYPAPTPHRPRFPERCAPPQAPPSSTTTSPSTSTSTAGEGEEEEAYESEGEEEVKEQHPHKDRDKDNNHHPQHQHQHQHQHSNNNNPPPRRPVLQRATSR